MSLQKREIAQKIVHLQDELSSIIADITKTSNSEDEDHKQDRINSWRLRLVVLEQEIDQLQKQFTSL